MFFAYLTMFSQLLRSYSWNARMTEKFELGRTLKELIPDILRYYPNNCLY
jgi:hypothetical protein